MKIEVYNRYEIENVVKNEPYFQVVFTAEKHFPDLQSDPNRLDWVKLRVHDIDTYEERKVPFSHDHAEMIWEKFSPLIGKVNLIVVSCDAGRSRSAGLAAAFGYLFNQDDTFIFNNPRYQPNMLIYRTMLNVGMRHLHERETSNSDTPRPEDA